MESLIIFGAKYLWIALLLLALYAFAKSQQKPRFLKFGAFLFPISYLLGVLARATYFNPRPFTISGVEPLIEHTADNGFPSDHALLAASLAVFILIANRRLGILAWVIAIAVAISRVLSGVHHPIDVIASVIISVVVGGMVYFLDNHKSNATNNRTSSDSSAGTA